MFRNDPSRVADMVAERFGADVRLTSLPIGWRDNAACRDLGPKIFYVDRGESSTEALAVCASCPVRLECLATALATTDPHGIWGGLSERYRRLIKRELRRRPNP